MELNGLKSDGFTMDREGGGAERDIERFENSLRRADMCTTNPRGL